MGTSVTFIFLHCTLCFSLPQHLKLFPSLNFSHLVLCSFYISSSFPFSIFYSLSFFFLYYSLNTLPFKLHPFDSLSHLLLCSRYISSLSYLLTFYSVHVRFSKFLLFSPLSLMNCTSLVTVAPNLPFFFHIIVCSRNAFYLSFSSYIILFTLP